jgi:hypothetical protein
MVLATALMRHDNQDMVIKQMRKLSDLLFPRDQEMVRKQEGAMKDVLRREGRKSYKVKVVKLGERSD